MNERPADLLLWLKDGCLFRRKACVAADTEVSIGRTKSERALGFIVTNKEKTVDFILDRDQVAELAAFLQLASGRLKKPVGRIHQISLVPMLELLSEARARGRELVRRKPRKKG